MELLYNQCYTIVCLSHKNKCRAARKYRTECQKEGIVGGFSFEECGDFISSTIVPEPDITDPLTTPTPRPIDNDETACNIDEALKAAIYGFCQKLMFENSLQNVMCSEVWH